MHAFQALNDYGTLEIIPVMMSFHCCYELPRNTDVTAV
jgi:hypothetical protein